MAQCGSKPRDGEQQELVSQTAIASTTAHTRVEKEKRFKVGRGSQEREPGKWRQQRSTVINRNFRGMCVLHSNKWTLHDEVTCTLCSIRQAAVFTPSSNTSWYATHYLTHMDQHTRQLARKQSTWPPYEQKKSEPLNNVCTSQQGLRELLESLNKTYTLAHLSSIDSALSSLDTHYLQQPTRANSSSLGWYVPACVVDSLNYWWFKIKTMVLCLKGCLDRTFNAFSCEVTYKIWYLRTQKGVC